MIDGGHIEDQAAARALGALAPDEAARVDEHVEGCPSCRGLLHEAQETADLLTLAVRAVRPPQHCKARVMELIAQEQPDVARSRRRWLPPLSSTPPAEQPSAQARLSSPASRTWTLRVLAGAALIALLAWNVSLQRETAQARMIRSMVVADHQPRALKPQAPGTSKVVARMFMAANGSDAVLVIENLPPPPPGKVYQIWVANEQSQRPMQTFRVRNAVEEIVMHAPEPFSKYKWVMITVENAGGSPAPSETTVLFGDL